MIGAVIGILLSVLSFVMPMPVVAPVFGLALGLNAIYKARGAVPNLRQYWAGIAAASLGVLGIALVLLRR